MNILLKEIQNYNLDAAKVLEKADFRTDSQIRSLTREDLHELFPGPEKLKLRRIIFEMINKQKPVEKLLKDLRGFIPDDSIKDALTSNGVLVDYLRLLKDMKAQLNNVQSFLEAHINLLEDIKAQPQQKQDAASFSVAGNPNDGCYRTASFENDGCYDDAQVTVKYKMVVSGTTFDAHLQILNQVKSSAQQLNLVESQSSEESQIVLVFCPIVSRVGTDVEGAMKMVMGDKPVILVMMNHAYEPKHVATMGSWDHNHKIVKHFSVFYHERVKGLINCKENNDAIFGIRQELLKCGGYTEPREHSASEKKVTSFFNFFSAK